MSRLSAARLLRVVAVAVAVAALVAACGGGDDDTPAAAVAAGSVAPTSTPATVHVSADAPSELSRMVCDEDEVSSGIEYYTGEKLTDRPAPTWVDRTYTCAYVLPDGTLTLSVKELDDVPQTDTWFDGLKTKLGDVGKVYLGQDGFQAPDGSIVVRKDNLVLFVDASQLADHPSPRSRGEVAVNVASIVMACWVGAS